MDFLRKLFFYDPPAQPIEVQIPFCPDCQFQLKLAFAGDAAVSQCPSCGGLFLDAESFDKICSDPGARLDDVRGPANSGNTTAPSEERGCPVCRAPMANLKFRGGVYLDSCRRGHGIWLDQGELELVHTLRQAAGTLTAQECQALFEKAGRLDETP